jgi:FMN phosphatase YigB (HAD superfamily)
MVSAVIFDLGSTLVDWPNWEEAVERFGEGFVSDMFEHSEPDEVVSLPRTQLVSVLERSGLMYVLVDAPPGDQTQPETLPVIMLAWEFAEGLRGR